jgi:hypothetical protein
MMFLDITDRLIAGVDPALAATVSALLLGWVALVYLVMASGVRSGDLVWAGRYVSRLPAEQRVWSLLYALGLIGSGIVLLELTKTIGTGLIDDRWLRSAGVAVVAFLGVASLFGLAKGSTWERMLFVPITLLGAGLAAWLTFG